jgi:hypothetical protein
MFLHYWHYFYEVDVFLLQVYWISINILIYEKNIFVHNTHSFHHFLHITFVSCHDLRQKNQHVILT